MRDWPLSLGPSARRNGAATLANASGLRAESAPPPKQLCSISVFTTPGLSGTQAMACVPLSPGVVNTEMLQSCFGGGADSARKPDAFAKVAAPFLLALGPKDNGQSLTVPA